MEDLGAALRAARMAAGLSLARMAARTSYSKPYLGQLETGSRAVRAEHVAAYEAALGVRIDGAATDSGAVEPWDELRPLLHSRRARQPGAQSRFTVDELAAAERRACWARTRQWRDTAPRAQVAGWLNGNRDRLRREPECGRALRVAAEIADIAAVMAWDIEEHRAAQRYSVQAARYAAAAGDPALAAATLAALVWQYLDRGRPDDGLEVAQLAQYISRRAASSRLRAALSWQEAWAHAMLGDRPAFRRAFAFAEDCRAEAESEVRSSVEPSNAAAGFGIGSRRAHGVPVAAPRSLVESDSAATELEIQQLDAVDRSLLGLELAAVLGPRRHWPGPGEQHRHVGHAYRELARTEPRFARTIARLPELARGGRRSGRPGDSVLRSIAVARAHLLIHEPDRAAASVTAALPLIGPCPTGRIAARLRDFHHESAEFATVPEIRATRSALAELTAHLPTTRALFDSARAVPGR
ncbi:helix-turn-helix domain-containing protein [Nocardia arthritidis]|uniref:Helix-turn-helix domain-containing protein n=1 Tax=Nocardia arthritidis TaxID=228602 RepID=A0A6G9YP31_9NOCA|nr:helix-turn-helix transcriptional regulator [Nocardia arthritidis]QIS14890.1 helix-turn-helix domain-containing protein [Nocardia arthritidis]